MNMVPFKEKQIYWSTAQAVNSLRTKYPDSFIARMWADVLALTTNAKKKDELLKKMESLERDVRLNTGVNTENELVGSEQRPLASEISNGTQGALPEDNNALQLLALRVVLNDIARSTSTDATLASGVMRDLWEIGKRSESVEQDPEEKSQQEEKRNQEIKLEEVRKRNALRHAEEVKAQFHELGKVIELLEKKREQEQEQEQKQNLEPSRGSRRQSASL